MTALIFALLLPMSCWSAPCSESRFGPCTPDAKQKKEIMDAVKDGRKMEEKMREADEKMKAAAKQGKKKEAAAKADEMLQFEREMRSHFSRAIKLADEYYRLNPGKPMNPTLRPKDPQGRGEWAAGLEIRWNPEFLYDKDHFREMQGSDGRRHYGGGRLDLAGTSGSTFADGAVFITRQTFEDAFTDDNPGVLAAGIHHEAGHFTELVTRGWDNFEEGELRTYQKSRSAAGVFELNGIRRQKIDQAIARHSRALSSGKRTSLFPGVLEERENERKFLEGQEKNREFFESLSRLKREIAEEDEKKKLLESIERGKREREAAEESKRREAEENARREKERTQREFERLLKLYGFRYLRKNPAVNLHILAQEEDPNQNACAFRFVYTHEARVALFLARSCQDMEIAGEAEEAAAILDQFSRDAQFRLRASLLFGGGGGQGSCVEYLLENYRPGSGEKGLKGSLSEHSRKKKADSAAWEEYLERLRQNEAIRKKREEEESRRQGREGREGGGGRPQCYDEPGVGRVCPVNP